MIEPDKKSKVDVNATASLIATSRQDSDATGQANQTIAARLVSLPGGFLQPDNRSCRSYLIVARERMAQWGR
jgi:hypothetical protein